MGDSENGQTLAPVALQARAGALFHPKAVEERERLVSTFEDNLDKTSAQIMRQDRADSVSGSHVHRAYETLVAPVRARRVGALLGSAVLGAALSAMVAFWQADQTGYLLTASLVAIVAGIATAMSARL